MIKKRACIISGGGSWNAFGGGTLERINGDYDIVIGVSTGSLLAPLTALNEWEYLKDYYLNLNDFDVYDWCWYKGKPLTKKGKIRIMPILLTVLLGQKSILTYNALRKTIDDLFSETTYNELQKQNKEIIITSQNFAQVPSKTHYFSSMNESHEEFKDWMWCGTNFPHLKSLIKKSWRDSNGNFHVGQWSDSEKINLIGVNELINNGFDEIDVVLHRTRNENRFEGQKINNFIENVVSSIQAIKYDIEYVHFYQNIRELNEHGTKVTVYWLPRNLSENSMVFDKNEMNNWWKEGYQTAFESERVEIFEPIVNKL